MSEIKFSDLRLPKIKRETQEDDEFLSYFVSVHEIPVGHTFRLSIKGQPYILRLPVVQKRENETDDVLLTKMYKSVGPENQSLILKNIFAKRQIRNTSFYKKREIREYVVDLDGNIWEIRVNNAKEKEPEVFIPENKSLAMLEQITKYKALNELTVEQIETLLAKKKGQIENRKEQTETKNPQKKKRGQALKEYWLKKKQNKQ